MDLQRWSAALGFAGTLLMAWPALRAAIMLRRLPPNTSLPEQPPPGETESTWTKAKRRTVARIQELAQHVRGHLFWMFVTGLGLTVISSFLNAKAAWQIP